MPTQQNQAEPKSEPQNQSQENSTGIQSVDNSKEKSYISSVKRVTASSVIEYNTTMGAVILELKTAKKSILEIQESMLGVAPTVLFIGNVFYEEEV